VTEEPPPDLGEATSGPSVSLRVAALATLLLGAAANLFCLLLLPVRFGGHLVPVAPGLALVANAGLATAATRLARDRLPAQLLLGLAIVLAGAAVTRGPGGDVLVTRDLEGMYLLLVIAACLGAAVPLLRSRKPSPPPTGPDPAKAA
jgi:hypothetical protein